MNTMISNIISHFFSINIIFIYFLFLGSLCSKPKILYKFSERIVDTNSNFTVLCEGDEPFTWSWPRIKHEDYTKWTEVSFHEEVKETVKYLNRIFLRNVTYLYTGFYTCYPKRIEFPEKDQLDSIYLFVHDDLHSFVNEQPLSITVTQYDRAIIPCRPTSPDISVTLTRFNGNEVYGSAEGKKYLLFDPRYGFILFDTSEVKRYLLLCRFVRLIAGDYVDVFFNVEPAMDYLEKPEIEFVSGGRNMIIEDSLVLKCKINTTRNVLLTWLTPPKISPHRIEISEQEFNLRDKFAFRELKIDRVAVEDSGVYYCYATDDKNHTNSTSSNVTVYKSLSDLTKYQANIKVEDNNAQEVVQLSTTELQVDNMQEYVTEFYIREDDYSIQNVTEFREYLPNSATPVLNIDNFNTFLVVYFYIVSFVIIFY